MNNYTAIVTLGRDPEGMKFGDREARKLRVVDKTYGKKAVDRWLSVIVTGKDVATADRLRKGDQIVVTGALIQEEYAPKKPKFKGEMVKDDVINFANILQVTRSPSFFGDADESAGAESGVADSEAGLADNPLADLA